MPLLFRASTSREGFRPISDPRSPLTPVALSSYSLRTSLIQEETSLDRINPAEDGIFDRIFRITTEGILSIQLILSEGLPLTFHKS